MYRGRSRGSYPPPGPSGPPRPYLGRTRPRAPYHPGHHDHGPPDSYRRSPPRRRYPSPGPGGHRGSDYWAGAPHRERSMSPRGAVPLDHNLVITVGNELTGQPGPVPSRLYDSDYSPRPGYERSHSRGRSPDRVSAKSHGQSKSRPRSQSRSPDRSRARSRGQSKSRPRSKSRSPDRSRARSRGRSKSRPRGKSRSPDRSRAGSRSKSRARSKSRSPYRSRAKSRGRSSKSRSRSRGRSSGPSYRKPTVPTHSNSRAKSRSSSSSSSSSSSTDRKEFKELAKARLKKELEETLNLPTKSILKKRIDCESPLLKTSGASQLADQLLQAVKGMAPHTVAAMLDELRSDPQMAQHAGLDSEIKEILVLLEGKVAKPQEKAMDDIDDEEKFLYGDSEDPRPVVPSESAPHHSFSELYGDMSEEALYGDFPQQSMSIIQPCSVHPKASPHVQTPPVESEGSTLRVSRLSRSPEPAYPPGTEPLEESERQALEEYEKIQDLLKTIGLDLGVTDISKMAARTKERLHGSKPPPKTPTRRKCHSSDSSDSTRRSKGWDKRSVSGSSSSRSRSRAGSWSSDDGCRKSSPAPKSNRIKGPQAERSDSVLLPVHKESLAQTPEPQPIPTVPITTYPSSQVHGMMPPSYAPPGYDQYGNYMAYMHQRWSHLYPPPNVALPPPSTLDKFAPSLSYNQSYIQPVPEATPTVKSVSQESMKGSSKVSSHDKRTSEDQNNESQKQKVLEEREKLRADREIRMKKKEYLMKELERLRKQQGELLRKKRREKDGHKDPLLREIGRLQEEVMAQISNLRKEHEAAEKKCSELEKVALILGLSPSDRPSKTNKPVEDHGDEAPPPEKKKREHQLSPEDQQAPATSSKKQSSGTESTEASAPCPSPPPEPFEYYDAGNHWCRNCNVTCGSMFDFFTHLHSKMHRKTLDPYDRPWASSLTTAAKKPPSAEKLTKPAKGSEFMIPVSGFFCLLCEKFFGDAICAEEHVTRHVHNEKYKKLMYEDPLYEQRRNLDRQAGLSLEMSGKKRKHEGEEKEEKSKRKKDKKEPERKSKEDNDGQKEEKLKHKKEEDEKLSRKEDLRNTKNLEVKSASTKKEEDEKSKFSKKDEKYQYSREEEDRDKHGKKDEDRHKYSREEDHHSRSHKEYDNKYEERSKYGPRDCENKYKYNKYSDSKHVRERDEGKPDLRKTSDPPPKPYDPPKIICGPSPAMRAKLRKQSLETSKPTPSASTSGYGKFSWKKRENVLAKEAEKVAAEFIKDDEEALKNSPNSTEDPFSKSIAAAKEIAEKLAGKATMPPPWVSSSANRGRIRPNLPGPAAVLRKTALICKPASLNTFLSIRPQNTPGVEPLKHIPLFPDPAPTASAGQTTPQEAKPVPCVATLDARPVPPVSEPVLPESKPDPPVSKPALSEAKPVQPVSKTVQVEAVDVPPGVNPVPPVSKPVPFEVKPLPQLVKSVQPVSTPLTSAVNPVLSVSKPAAQVSKPTQLSEMIKIVSDVAAPGVPESEQTRTVFVKPPPFLNTCEGSKKLVKSNLAAAKAQDLFDIFYSSIGQSGPSSVTKPPTEAKKSPFRSPQSVKPQPLSKAQPEPQPLSQPEPKSLSQPEAQPVPQSLSQSKAQPLPQPLSQPEPQPLSQPEPKSLSHPEAQPVPQSLSQPEPQPLSQPEPKSLSQPELQPEPQPLSQPEPKSLSQPEPQPLPQPLSQPEPQSLSQPEAQPEPQPLSQPEPKSLSQPEAQPLPQPLSQPEAQSLSQPEAQPLPQPLSQPEAQPLPQPLSQPEAQPLPQPLSQPEAQPLPQPLSQPEAQSLSQPEAQSLSQPEAQSLSQPEPWPSSQPEPQPLTQFHPEAEPEKQPKSIEIHTSQPTLQTEPIPECDLVPPRITAECISVQSEPVAAAQAVVQDVTQNQSQSFIQKSEQTSTAVAKSLPQTKDKPQPQLKVVLQCLPNPQPVPQTEPAPDQDSQTLSFPETSLSLSPTALVPQSEPKPSPKTRGKSTAKKAPAQPIRQTRYQTRRQQLQQTKVESEPELDSGHTESTVPALKGQDPNQGSVSLPEKVTSNEDEAQALEITPETLGLPSDMTSLDFDYDFDFE